MQTTASHSLHYNPYRRTLGGLGWKCWGTGYSLAEALDVGAEMRRDMIPGTPIEVRNRGAVVKVIAVGASPRLRPAEDALYAGRAPRQPPRPTFTILPQSVEVIAGLPMLLAA